MNDSKVEFDIPNCESSRRPCTISLTKKSISKVSSSLRSRFFWIKSGIRMLCIFLNLNGGECVSIVVVLGLLKVNWWCRCAIATIYNLIDIGEKTASGIDIILNILQKLRAGLKWIRFCRLQVQGLMIVSTAFNQWESIDVNESIALSYNTVAVNDVRSIIIHDYILIK